MPRSRYQESPTLAAGSQSNSTGRVTRSQAVQLQAVGVGVERRKPQASGREPVTINWVFFDRTRRPNCFPVKIPFNLFDESSADSRGLFVQELKNEFRLDADLHSIQFWKPKSDFPLDLFSGSEWPETFTDMYAIAKNIPGAQAFSRAFSGEFKEDFAHLLVTAVERFGISDEVSALPEISHFLSNINYDGLAPFQAARASEYAKIQSEVDGAIYDGQYADDGHPTTAAPIQIYHPIFEAFIRRLERPIKTLAPMFLTSVREISITLSGICCAEQKFGRAFQNALKETLGHALILENNDDDTGMTGNIVIEVNKRRIRICHIEIKAEMGEGGCDPSIQAGLSARHYWVHHKEFFPILDRTCCPMILLAGGGPSLTVLGAVFTDRPIVQRLTDMLWLGVSSTLHQETRIMGLARFFLALRDSIEDLINYYTEIANNLQDVDSFIQKPTGPHPRFYPYVNFVETAKGETIHFKYLGRLQDSASCVTFRAKLLGDSQLIVVKFVTCYGSEVHELLHKHGYAPELLYHGPIPTTGTILDSIPLPGDPDAEYRRRLPSMNMVVMEFIEPHGWPYSRKTASKQLEEALEILHEAGYVFGNLGKPNVLFTVEGKLQLIDFDWAGRCEREGEDGPVKWEYAQYPADLSQDIRWAKGVDAFEAIRPEHDLEMMGFLLDEVYPI